MNDEPIYPELCYAIALPQWLTCEQAGQEFQVLQRCASPLLRELAAERVIRRQFCYGAWFYARDDVALVAATLERRRMADLPARHTRLHRPRKG
jgi:hypothetical protein